jgi:hypothetical protein
MRGRLPCQASVKSPDQLPRETSAKKLRIPPHFMRKPSRCAPLARAMCGPCRRSDLRFHGWVHGRPRFPDPATAFDGAILDPTHNDGWTWE